jgi:hypothetical protein
MAWDSEQYAVILRAKGVESAGMTPTGAKQYRDKLKAIFGPGLVKGSLRRPNEIVASVVAEARRLRGE